MRASRRVMALAACLGLLGGSITSAMYMAGTEGYFGEFTPDDDELAELEHLGVEDERLGYAELAAEIGAPAPDRYIEAYESADQETRDGFQRCAEELAGQGSRPSHLREAIARLERQGMATDVAMDTVMDTLIKVCLKNAEQGIDDLGPYFARSVCNNSKKHYRQSRYCDLDSDLIERCACDDRGPRVQLARKQELAILHAAFDDLPAGDREVLELYYIRDMTHGELAACRDLDVRLEFGLQTIHRNEQLAVHRPNHMERVDQAIGALHERGIRFEVSLIYGLPEQTLESFTRTVDWCLSRGVPVIKAFPLMLLRGTELERERDRWHLEENDDDIPAVVASDSFTVAEWREMRALARALARTEGAHPASASGLEVGFRGGVPVGFP